ncbi:hypothetical protein [Micromonospora sp. DT62]
MQPRPLTIAQLADGSRRDDVLAVADLYAPGQDLGKVPPTNACRTWPR